MVDPIAYKIDLSAVPLGEGLYSKVDFCRISRLEDNFALLFYQLNYQAVVDFLDENIKGDKAQPQPVLVSKLVVDKAGFARMLAMFQEIAKSSGLEEVAS